MRKIFLSGALVCLLAPTASALTVPSDGSDGAFTPGASLEVDLSLAADAAWDSPGSGNGVYDGDEWAVVFKFTSVDVPSGVNVTFLNHPKRAPVVWLVQGDVNIAGLVDLSGAGQTGTANIPSESGPGGHRGGAGKPSEQISGSGGFGPGGGGFGNPAGGGSHGSQAEGATAGAPYGNQEAVPLIGGSGGGSRTTTNSGGGAGGGAILIVAGGTITVDGEVRANGGAAGTNAGGGSGGAIRLVAEAVEGTGEVNALEGAATSAGGVGRIRIEANSVSVASVSPPPSLAAPDDPPQIWPAETFPSLRVIQIDYTDAQGLPQSVMIPADPAASLEFPNADAGFESDLPVDVLIEAANVPLDWTVTLLVTPLSGAPAEVPATFQSGDATLSTWSVLGLALEGGFSAMQVRGDAP